MYASGGLLIYMNNEAKPMSACDLAAAERR